jgi:hypothetical protein
LYLKPEPSRVLKIWWCALHALLAVAALLVGWPWPVRAAWILAVLIHAALRRPRATPSLLIVGADGSWQIPEWGHETLPLARGSVLTPLGLALHLGIGPKRRHVLLLRDQVGPDDWRRLSAIMRRARMQA